MVSATNVMAQAPNVMDIRHRIGTVGFKVSSKIDSPIINQTKKEVEPLDDQINSLDHVENSPNDKFLAKSDSSFETDFNIMEPEEDH